eukprot:TRINITY_DN10418_c0_g1_i8.p1 TRINITY_DN10418_c0_g1~~TRINITY_DN10418_c0_g1_i8.p1  ORF type:complete len:235 (+),score=-11.80 TRINITY_DN10418_c0_g1_i8:281-985(+)
MEMIYQAHINFSQNQIQGTGKNKNISQLQYSLNQLTIISSHKNSYQGMLNDYLLHANYKQLIIIFVWNRRKLNKLEADIYTYKFCIQQQKIESTVILWSRKISFAMTFMIFFYECKKLQPYNPTTEITQKQCILLITRQKNNRLISIKSDAKIPEYNKIQKIIDKLTYQPIQYLSFCKNKIKPLKKYPFCILIYINKSHTKIIKIFDGQKPGQFNMILNRDQQNCSAFLITSIR